MDSGIRKKVMESGAGIAVALVVILLFVLAATFLKSLVFGIIAAYFLLPLEKFFENRVFGSRMARRCASLAILLFSPFARLRDRLMRKKDPRSSGEQMQARRERLVLNASLAAFLTCIGAVVLFLLLTASILIPMALDTGRAINSWAAESPVLKQAESKVAAWISREKGSARDRAGQGRNGETERGAETPADDGTAVSASLPEDGASADLPERSVSAEMTLQTLFEKLRPLIREYIQANRSEVAMFAFSRGKGILGTLFSLASHLGTFAFDILLFVFFLLFFLQKMALFRDAEGKANVGEWCVHALFSTAWLPATTEKTRTEAAGIINTIGTMFQRWVRGYISIILIESVLYLILFSLFSVPYAIPLAVLAGLTILLPFLGPIASFALTAGVCIGFCESHLVVTLIGVIAAYCLINGILEQLILYPSFVGGAIGLSTLETILVVLIGGLVAGIAGMILAVPAAAVIKYLIPKLYDLRCGMTADPPGEGAPAFSAPEGKKD